MPRFKTKEPLHEVGALFGSFFDILDGVSEIVVLGHSLSEVDAPYIFEILDHINPLTTRWTISYYMDSTKERRNFARFRHCPKTRPIH
ncbi:hypothetical protein GR211_05115 [Rhizobium leguminosarum]|uniref:AbiH family protein n=1 Tax=Rhizobium ruizarguesonis TaxID=2081791 RepID=UPI0013B94E82|nr:hypothetical protein [Rhizobium ruizarguesonis]NEK26290.1 hypothetical protein [Rhizobium ruizarguesonis]